MRTTVVVPMLPWQIAFADPAQAPLDVGSAQDGCEGATDGKTAAQR
jgi:hypothetical protein